MDINTYLQYIGVDSSQLLHGADPESLKLIYTRHVRSIPFNSAPLICGHPVDPNLDVHGISDRMLAKRWGGVCFEHVALLSAALERLGFDVAYLGGEVWAPQQGWSSPLGHASLLVSFPDRTQYYCDPGFPLRPLEPLLLAHGAEQRQSDGRAFVLERQRPEDAPGDGQPPQPPPRPPTTADVLPETTRRAAAPCSTGPENGCPDTDTVMEKDRETVTIPALQPDQGAEPTARGSEKDKDSGYWVLHRVGQDDNEVMHRFKLLPRALSDFSEPARRLADPDHRFMNGWLMAACRLDGALVTLAVGHWAGSAVPPDKAKYVCRQVVGGAAGGALQQQQQPLQHVQHTALLTRGSAALRSLLQRDFPLRVDGLGCKDFEGDADASAADMS